jgi:hypothetical protein
MLALATLHQIQQERPQTILKLMQHHDVLAQLRFTQVWNATVLSTINLPNRLEKCRPFLATLDGERRYPPQRQ